ncbi:MAG: hypothetical protein RJA70_1565 [Pseudomonadota bacterium]|jgi:HPt (histidine-containing phosphotransfer) domain-containing protein
MNSAAPRSLYPVFDLETLDQLSDLIDGDDASFLDELFESYLETAAETLATLRSQVDQDLLRRAAHTLKGSSLNVGAARVAATCKDLEAHLRTGAAIPDMPHRVATIEAQIQTVRERYPTTLAGLAVRASA